MKKMAERKILIVDDSESCSILAVSRLSRLGIEKDHIVITHSKEEALQKMDQETFDVIIVQEEYPICGIEIAQCIKERCGEYMPHVIGYINPLKEKERSCFDDTIIKPILYEDFVEKIFNVVMKQEATAL